jgi:hypothetical protein
MHFAPLDYPWKFILDSLFTSAMVYVGMRYERYRSQRRYRAVVKHAQHAWEGWTEEDVKHELRTGVDFERKPQFTRKSGPLEQYRTAKETIIDIGGYMVILHPGDAFRVQRLGEAEPPVSWFGERLAESDESIAHDPVKFYEALTGQIGGLLNYTIAIRCLTCKRPAPLEVHPIDGVTAFELIQPEGWRLDFESVTRPHLAFSLRCADCRKDPLHESEPSHA